MNPPIDTSAFPVGAPGLDYESEEEIAALEALRHEARLFIESFRWAPPVDELVLAFGMAPQIGLFLVRFATGVFSGEGQGDKEIWVVVGDLPSIYCETDVTTPADALRLYCAIAQDWADTVKAGGDLSPCFPIRAEPTQEHADMLLSRIAFIREEFIPIAKADG